MKNVVLGLFAVALFVGCASAPKSDEYADDMSNSCKVALEKFTKNDEALQKKLADSAGYVVYPLVVKAGVGFLGYGYGEGSVFQGGDVSAYTTINDINVAFQWGGHGYSLLIVFDTEEQYKAFLAEKFQFGAGLGAVFFPWGIGLQAHFAGTSVYFYSRGGLMYSASIDGFAYSVALDE